MGGRSMVLIIGFVILFVAALLAVVGVGVNGSHSLTGDFAFFGQHMTGLTTGRLFLYGIVVGLVAALGLSILRGVFTRGLASRDLQRELKKSQAESATLRLDFERLNKELAAERAKRVSNEVSVSKDVTETLDAGE